MTKKSIIFNKETYDNAKANFYNDLQVQLIQMGWFNLCSNELSIAYVPALLLWVHCIHIKVIKVE